MALTIPQQERVDALKRMLGDAAEGLTDEQLWALIASGLTFNAIASEIWTQYAAKTATLIDMSEGSSRRNLGDIYEQALRMAQFFRDADINDPSVTGRTRTRRIVRAGGE